MRADVLELATSVLITFGAGVLVVVFLGWLVF